MLPNTRKYRKLSSHKVLNESIEFWFQTLNQLLFLFSFIRVTFPSYGLAHVSCLCLQIMI